MTNKQAPDPATWSCKIGEVTRSRLPEGADSPMRRAVEHAYIEITGEAPHFIFSGWGAELDKAEREVQTQAPDFSKPIFSGTSVAWIKHEDNSNLPLGFIVEVSEGVDLGPDFMPLPHGQMIPSGHPLYDVFEGRYPDLRGTARVIEDEGPIPHTDSDDGSARADAPRSPANSGPSLAP